MANTKRLKGFEDVCRSLSDYENIFMNIYRYFSSDKKRMEHTKENNILQARFLNH